MPEAVYDMFIVAGDFPPGLNTADPPTKLAANETPDGYGYSMSNDGVLQTGTIPGGTARVAKTYTITAGALSVPYIWHYNRLWNITNRTAATASNILRWGMPKLETKYYPQRAGAYEFNEDAQTIVQIIPFGADSMMVAKSTGSYVISNLADTRAFFQFSSLIQEMGIATSTHIVELDGVVYASNSAGMFAYEGGKVVEITRKVRDGLTNFSSVALVADYQKKRIIGGTSYVYEVDTQKLLRWSGSTFRFTSRQYHLPDWKPFDVDRLLFVIEHGSTAGGTITYQIKFEDEDWQDARDIDAAYAQEKYTTVTEGLAQARSVRKFQVRLTALSSNIYIKEIRLDNQAFDEDSYAT